MQEKLTLFLCLLVQYYLLYSCVSCGIFPTTHSLGNILARHRNSMQTQPDQSFLRRMFVAAGGGGGNNTAPITIINQVPSHGHKGGHKGKGKIKDCGIHVPEKFVAVQKVIEVPRISVFEPKHEKTKTKAIKFKKKKKKCKHKKCGHKKEKIELIEIDGHDDDHDDHYGYH